MGLQEKGGADIVNTDGPWIKPGRAHEKRKGEGETKTDRDRDRDRDRDTDTDTDTETGTGTESKKLYCLPFLFGW